jgi:hypothetical protein
MPNFPEQVYPLNPRRVNFTKTGTQDRGYFRVKYLLFDDDPLTDGVQVGGKQD